MLRLQRQHSPPRRDGRPFTLIEVMIAFSLVAILISTLMGFYWQLNVLQVESDKVRRQAFHLRFLQSRLADVLPRTVQPKSPDLFFYVSDQEEGDTFAAPSLVFCYDNGTDIDPDFSNEVLARLYRVEHNGRGELWLATWPRPGCSLNPTQVRRELLMENVASIAFSAYQPPEPIQGQTPAQSLMQSARNADEVPIEQPPPDSWESLWKMTYWSLPAILTLTVTPAAEKGVVTNQVPLEFYFPLPNNDHQIMMVP